MRDAPVPVAERPKTVDPIERTPAMGRVGLGAPLVAVLSVPRLATRGTAPARPAANGECLGDGEGTVREAPDGSAATGKIGGRALNAASGANGEGVSSSRSLDEVEVPVRTRRGAYLGDEFALFF